MMLFIMPQSSSQHLARSAGRDTGAASALLSTSDAVARPGPVGAATLTAKDVDVSTLGGDSTLDVLNSEASNRDTGSGLASGGAVLVVLLDDDTILGDVLESDVLVGNARDGTSGARDGLDADTVVRVDNSVVRDDDVLDYVVAATTNGADGDTVTARAGSTSEVDVSTGVDSQAVVLVLDVGVGDVDTSGATNIKGVGVVATVGYVTSSVVDGDLVKGKVLGAVNGETLDRGVLDVESGDGGRGHGVGVEKLAKSAKAQ
jgi:hypothetical protein